MDEVLNTLNKQIKELESKTAFIESLKELKKQYEEKE